MLPSCGISILINLTPPGATGPVGTMLQQETHKTTPPIKTITNKVVARLMISSPSFQICPNIHQWHA